MKVFKYMAIIGSSALDFCSMMYCSIIAFTLYEKGIIDLLAFILLVNAGVFIYRNMPSLQERIDSVKEA
jgi:hypothetical protein